MKHTKEKTHKNAVCLWKLYNVIRLNVRNFSGISGDRHENEANPFIVMICETIKIIQRIPNHLIEDLIN